MTRWSEALVIVPVRQNLRPDRIERGLTQRHRGGRAVLRSEVSSITVSRRTPSGWEETEYRKNEVVSGAGPEVDVNELYRVLEGI